MKKKLGLGFIGIGILIIAISLVISMTSGNGLLRNNNLIDTSKVTGEKLDSDKYEDYSYEESFESSYLKSHDTNKKTIISYPVMKNVENKDVSSEFTNSYYYSDISISSYVVNNTDIESFIEKTLSDFSTDENIKYNYNKGNFNVNELEIPYLKVSYIVDEKYVDEFYFLIKISDDEFAVINYFSNDKKLTDEFISRVAKEIKKEDNKASYLITTAKDGFLYGTLTSMVEGKSEPVKFNFTVRGDIYEEVVDGKNTKNHTTFKKKDDKTTITYELAVNYSSNIVKDLTELIMSNYSDIKNPEIHGLDNKTVTVKGKIFSKISFNYKEGENIKYSNIYIEKIYDNVVCIISITGSNDETIVNDFLNYSY